MKNGQVLENSKDILSILEQAGPMCKIFDVIDVTDNLAPQQIIGPIVDRLCVGRTYQLRSLTLVYDEYWPQDKNHIACFRNMNKSDFSLGKLNFCNRSHLANILCVHTFSIFPDSVAFFESKDDGGLHPVLIVVHDIFKDLLVNHFGETNMNEIDSAYSAMLSDVVDELSAYNNSELDISLYPEEYI